MKFYRVLTLVLITALPLIPIQLDTRITYAIILYALVLLPVFLKSLKNRLKEKDQSIIFFLIFLFASTMSTVFSTNFKQSLVQLALFMAYFIIFVSVSRVFESPKSRQHLALVFLLAASLLSIISLYNTAILHIINRQTIGVSFMWVYFGHNHLSALLIFAIPIAIYFAKTYFKNRQAIPGFLFLILSLFFLVTFYFTFARASQISLLAALISAIIIFDLPRQKLAILTLAVSLGAIGIILAASNTHTRQFGIDKYNTFQKNTRLVYWQQAINNSQEHPFLGTGLDTFRIINESNSKSTLKTFYTHNFFLQMLSDAGILGLASSLGLILSVLRQARLKTLNSKEGTFHLALLVGLLASTINSLIDFDWQLPVVFLFFWLFSGLFLTSHKKHE